MENKKEYCQLTQIRNEKTKQNQLNLRLWFSGAAFVHLLFLACKLLTIEFESSEDPKVRLYAHARWKLLTCWFNLVMLAYYPLSFYCDWREKRRELARGHVRFLNRIRHLVFCSIILPTTIFADTIFWRLWNKDRELIAPSSVDGYVPFWTHHCMHTVSLIVVLVDLAIVPRKKPKDLTLNLAVLTAWVAAYLVTVLISWMQEIYVYPLFGTLTKLQIVMFCASMYIEHLLYFYLQWCFLDLVAYKKDLPQIDELEEKSMPQFEKCLKKETKYL